MADDADIAAARRAALILAAIGLAVAGIPIVALARIDRAMLADWINRFGAGGLFGAAALLVAAFHVAPLLAQSTTGRGWRACVESAAGAIASLVISTAIGGAAGLLFQANPFVFGIARAAVDQIAKPIYWVLLFGGVPALALGACHPALARRIRRRLGAVATPPAPPYDRARPPS